MNRSAVMLQKEIEPKAKRPSTVPEPHRKAAPKASNPTSSRPFRNAVTGESGSDAKSTMYTAATATTAAGQNHGRRRSPSTIHASTMAISGCVCCSTNVSANSWC